jgi:hypothetical protein
MTQEHVLHTEHVDRRREQLFGYPFGEQCAARVSLKRFQRRSTTTAGYSSCPPRTWRTAWRTDAI